MQSFKDFWGKVGVVLLLSFGVFAFFVVLVVFAALTLAASPFILLYMGVKKLIKRIKQQRLWRKKQR